MSEHKYWHQNINEKKGARKYLVVIFAALLLVAGLYYVGTYRGDGGQKSNFASPDEQIISGLIEVTGGDETTVQEFAGDNVKTVTYLVMDRVRDDIIADALQFLTKNSWTINSGTEFSDGSGYLISAFEESKNQNLQISLDYQGAYHSVSLMYSE